VVVVVLVVVIIVAVTTTTITTIAITIAVHSGASEVPDPALGAASVPRAAAQPVHGTPPVLRGGPLGAPQAFLVCCSGPQVVLNACSFKHGDVSWRHQVHRSARHASCCTAWQNVSECESIAIVAGSWQ